jgi:hypothetical protein
MNPITFACDGVPGCTAEVRSRIGPVAILRGVGVDSGRWFVRGTSGVVRAFGSEGEARNLADYIAQDDAPGFNTGKQTPERGQRAKLDQLEKKYNLEGLSPEELEKYRRLKKLVASDDESATSAQHRAMGAAAGGNSNLGIPKSVGGQRAKLDQLEKKYNLEGLSPEELEKYRRLKKLVASDDESATSAQHRAMGAAAGGNSNLGIPKSVGKEFMRADKGKFSKDSEYSDRQRLEQLEKKMVESRTPELSSEELAEYRRLLAKMPRDKGKFNKDSEYSDFERARPNASKPDKHGSFRGGANPEKPRKQSFDPEFERARPGAKKPDKYGSFGRGGDADPPGWKEPTREEVQAAYRGLSDVRTKNPRIAGQSGMSQADLRGMREADAALHAADAALLCRRSDAQRVAMLERGVAMDDAVVGKRKDLRKETLQRRIKRLKADLAAATLPERKSEIEERKAKVEEELSALGQDERIKAQRAAILQRSIVG